MAISFEEAKKVAKGKMPNVDTYREYKNGYVFYNKKNAKNSDGGGEIVVAKDSGKPMPFFQFINMYDVERTPSAAKPITAKATAKTAAKSATKPAPKKK